MPVQKKLRKNALNRIVISTTSKAPFRKKNIFRAFYNYIFKGTSIMAFIFVITSES